MGDLAKAKSRAAADPFTYWVQAGAYAGLDDASAQKARLSMLGVQSRVSEREQNGRVVYRVRVGPYDTREDAEKIKESLDGAGIDSALVRIQR